MKPPSELGSYRPISLTSCVAKLMERVLSERLYDLAETGGWFSGTQAGFRKGRGVEDQILRVSQNIWDAFENREKSILVLLDFSKAYDRIWRQRLLHSLLDRGVPHHYVAWLNNFLNNRQAKVQFNGATSRSRKIVQGLPQGSVLAPILFLFYINQMAEQLPDNITASLYADDVAILASSTSKPQAVKLAQEATNTVSTWSKEWKLTLNGSKSEYMIFSQSHADSQWSPNIVIDDIPLKRNQNAKFLGITFDRTLTFNQHVTNVVKKAARKLKLLAAVAHSTWGWRKSDLTKVYLSHVRSIINYAGSGWQPWLSASRINDLESIQNRGLRLITSQALSSPIDALRAETGVGSIASSIQMNTIRSREKALRIPTDHPRRLAFQTTCRKRLKRKSAREKAEEWSHSFDCHQRSPLSYFSLRPWERGLSRGEVHPYLPGVDTKSSIPPEEIGAIATRRARELCSQYNIYTDGSASNGTTKGGAGVVVTSGDAEQPTIVANLQQRGAAITCSYDEELRAMQMAVDWSNNNVPDNSSVTVFTDSQSLCIALKGTSPAVDRLRRAISTAKPHITIQWVPGHCGVPGNEMADEAAKAAASKPGPSGHISYKALCAAIKLECVDPPPTHLRTKNVYASLSHQRDAGINTRSDQTLLAKLRSGHYIGLRAYRARIAGTPQDPNCDLCDEEVPQTLEHWVQCPALSAARRNLIGEDYTDLDILTRYPTEAIALARRSLLGARK